MHEFSQKQIENGFSEFEGLSVTGTVPVRESLLNSFLAEALQKLAEGTTPSPSPAPPAGGLLPAVAKLVKKAEVHAKEGVIVFDFEIKR